MAPLLDSSSGLFLLPKCHLVAAGTHALGIDRPALVLAAGGVASGSQVALKTKTFGEVLAVKVGAVNGQLGAVTKVRLGGDHREVRRMRLLVQVLRTDKQLSRLVLRC